MPETTPLPLLRWPCDLARPAPHRVQIFRGETVRLEALLTLNGAPVEIPAGATATIAWQSREMGGSWYVAEASLDTERGTVWADFGPDKDAGADEYRAFLRVDTDGACYRAVAALQILPSPGATINEIPIPPRVLDFATIEVLNAPYWTKAEADARFAVAADIPDPSTADPQMDGAASAGASDAYARGDHRHPTDTSRASTEDATLNERGLGEWTCVPATVEWYGEEVRVDRPYWADGAWVVDAVVGGEQVLSNDPDAASLTYMSFGQTITATRTALPGYVLGSQTEKPIPKLSDVPVVVAPSTSASDAGKAADAKAVGDALAGKLGTNGGAINGDLTVSQSGPSSGGNISASAVTAGALTVQGTATISTLNLNGGGLQINGTTFPAETWEFTLDDDSTVQKQILVAPVAAQGGA